jgi:hypothetical protein
VDLGAVVKQDIRLAPGWRADDRTLLKTTNVKGNWQATSKDGQRAVVPRRQGEVRTRDRCRAGRSAVGHVEPGQQLPRKSAARPAEGREQPCVLVERVPEQQLTPTSARVRLEPQGGLDDQASISARLGQTFGTTRASRFLRPQHIVNLDGNVCCLGERTTSSSASAGGGTMPSQTIWPGDLVVAYDNSPRQARAVREGAGTNRPSI